MEKFVVERKIGEGAYGEVHLVFEKIFKS